MTQARSVFGTSETHGILQQFGARVGASSEGLGWTSAFASTQREQPFEGRFHELSDCLLVLHRSGPIDVAFNMGGRSVSRHIPKGGVFFLPAGHACNVHLRGPLDTTHIYLRAHLFEAEDGPQAAAAGLAPIFGERDSVLEHLACAVGEIVAESAPSLSVDPIAQALANRFIDINFKKPFAGPARRDYRLTDRQLRRVREFIDQNIDTNVPLPSPPKYCASRGSVRLPPLSAARITSWPTRFAVAIPNLPYELNACSARSAPGRGRRGPRHNRPTGSA
jgi:AraC family transcriptional regulator